MRQCSAARGVQHEVALPRPAAPQRLRLPALQLQVNWLRLTLEEIVDSYTKLYGKESRESDIGSDERESDIGSDESSAAEEVEED